MGGTRRIQVFTTVGAARTRGGAVQWVAPVFKDPPRVRAADHGSERESLFLPRGLGVAPGLPARGTSSLTVGVGEGGTHAGVAYSTVYIRASEL